MFILIKNLADILIVSYLIYICYLFIARTYYLEIFKGFLILILFYFISTYFHLKTLSWILKNLFSGMPIFLIILFQNEIKNFILQLGIGKKDKLLLNKKRNNIPKNLANIIFHFKFLKTGVLIVLRGKDNLNSSISRSSWINGRWSKELFLSIFQKQSPLHDGACIIYRKKILSAGAILPTSKQKKLSKFFGTRHLSAIGISEVSDALAITVSEETSKVSFAKSGFLKYDVTKKDLIKEIHNFLLSNETESHKNHYVTIFSKYIKNSFYTLKGKKK